MSSKLLEDVRAAREALIEQQRICHTCGKECEDADHLFMHLVIRHDALLRR